jgi:hypothetical protein
VTRQRPAAGTRLPYPSPALRHGGVWPAVSIDLSTRDQHAPIPADADGPLARIASLDQRVGHGVTARFARVAGDGRSSLALFLQAIPWPLPRSLHQPAGCADPRTLTVRLLRGGSLAYGPCRRPAAIDRLVGALREAQLFRRAVAPHPVYPHPVREAYLTGAGNVVFTPGGSMTPPISHPLRLITWALHGTFSAPRPCRAGPFLVLRLNDGRTVRYGSCPQPAAIEQLRGAMEYAASHRAPKVLAWPVRS